MKVIGFAKGFLNLTSMEAASTKNIFHKNPKVPDFMEDIFVEAAGQVFWHPNIHIAVLLQFVSGQKMCLNLSVEPVYGLFLCAPGVQLKYHIYRQSHT